MNSDDIPKRYEFSGTALSGGQGDVYICTDTNLARTVAIKFLQDVDEMERLLGEILALQSLRSNHVVEIYDLVPGFSDKEIGLVEEYIEGDDLKSTLDSGEPISTINELLRTLYQVSFGIFDIHNAGIIHRDIKLNNMKLNGEGHVKIFDFGLSKIVGPESKTKGFKGTAYYAAPELYVQGDSTVVTQKAVDIYAFRVSAWLLATGELPNGISSLRPTAATQTILTVRGDIPSEKSRLLVKA